MRLNSSGMCVLVAQLVVPLVLFLGGPAPGQTEPASEPPAPAGSAPADALGDKTIRFSFKGATFEQVIDFFSRTTGMPVVWETEPPGGTLDYLSPESYSVPEALRVLNIILQSKGVMLRRSDEMLYLQKLTEMQRENIPTYIGEIPIEVTDDQIVTVIVPLNTAVAPPLAEKLAAMVASYGSVTALDQQNALLITETAAQVRRLVTILGELDRQDPEGAVEIILVRHTTAKAVMEPLKALLSETIERVVLDKQNKPKKIKEQRMTGLSISFDERTNSIIAKGVQSRIDKLKDTLALLDVPTTNGGRLIRTISLAVLSPQDAVTTLDKLFSKLPEAERPTVLPHEAGGGITVVGKFAVEEAGQLLRQIEGEPADGADEPETITVIAIEQVDPAALIRALNGLMTRRQQAVLKMIAGPDGRSLVVSGPVRDVDALRTIVPVLDRPGRAEKQVRLVRLTTRDPVATVQRAQELYAKQVKASGQADDPKTAVLVELDPDARMLTLIGEVPALDSFAAVMRTVESTDVVDRETRQIDLANAVPSRVAGPLGALAQQLLQPRDGTPYAAPQIEAVDALDLLIVTAEPAQFAVLDSLVATFDKPDPSDYQFRVIPLAGVDDVPLLVERTGEAYARLSRGYEEGELIAPESKHDALTGNLIVTGRGEAVRLYEQALAEARRLLPPARSGTLIPLRQAKASEVIGPLMELWKKTGPVDAARDVPDPAIEVIERTNSLYVVAEPVQQATIARLVQELDTFEPTDLPPLRLIQVRAADAGQIANMLKRRYDARPPEQRREMPVTIDADAGTNTLIVTAHTDVYGEIKEFVDGVNRAEEESAERQTMIFPLRRARATELSQALEKLYPEPPMPTDRRGRPLPDLRKPREVYVSADAATNTLIIEAPAERRASFEALVEQLDRVELPPAAELRTYSIERGDPDLIARTLTELARRGVLSQQPPDGSKPVEVLVQAEPRSRTLIVAGDEFTFEKIEEILDDLEVVPIQRSLKVFEIAGADPQSMADRAVRLYDEQTADIPGAQPVSVEIDRDRGMVLVVAEDEAMFRFASILGQLQETIGPPPDVRLLPLEYAGAGDVVLFLRDLAESHLTMAGGRAGPVPMFEAIERTNSVLVAAQREQHDIIRALVDGLDRVEPKEMPPLRILQVRSADAQNLASALMKQYGQRPVEERNEKPVSISADAQTNALIIAAHPDLLPEIQGIVDELNTTRRMDSEGREIRIFPLKVARAPELAKTLDDMFPAPPVPVDRRGRPMPGLGGMREQRDVVVRADAQTNSIIVDAPVQRMQGFEQLVQQLDRAKIAEETLIRTYPVVHADVERVAGTLQQLAAAGTLDPGGQDRSAPVTVSSDSVSRTLIVSGPAEVFDRVESVLADLDVKRAGPSTSIRFFRLEHARAESLVPMLRQVLVARIVEDVAGAGADVEALLQVTADRKTNTLIISAPDEILPVAEELVTQLDDSTASIGDPLIRVRPLTFADAGEVASSLGSALPQMISAVTGEPVDVRLIPAAGSNAIILVGIEQDLEAVERLIEPLDTRTADDAIDARTFTLSFASAEEVAPLVQNLLTDQLSNDPRVIIERIRRSRGQVDLTPGIRVEAIGRTNSLIVSGPMRTVALAEMLIEQLDRPDGAGSRTFDSYTAVRADPARLAESVRRVMEATQPAGMSASVEIIAEPESGTVLVIGAANEVERAKMLLAKRDAEARVAPQVDLKVIALEHSDAGAAAQAIGALLADQTRWPEALRATIRAGIPVGQPAVIADAPANRLLISAPTELMPLARALVDEIDRPQDGDASMEVRTFTLSRADASEVAEAVSNAIAVQAARRPGAAQATVTATPSSSAIVVAAPPEQMGEIEAIVAGLDEGFSTDQSQVRTVFLKHARADTVAPIVEELLKGDEIPFWQRFQPRRNMPDRGPDVRVAADTRLNAVVISAPLAVLDIAAEMVAQLDLDPVQDPSRRRSVRVLVVENADAAELAENLDAMFDREDEGSAPPVIRVDAASNSLLVRATDEQFESISMLIDQIDDATISTARQMQLVPIDASKASAADVARTLQRMLDRTGGSRVEVITLEELMKRRESDARKDASAAPVGEGFLDWARTRQEVVPSPMDSGAAVLSVRRALDDGADVTIAVDPATNSLILIGSPRALERLVSLAEQVQEQLPAEPGRVRYVALPPEADAQGLARLIDQTLRQLTPPGGERGDLRRRASVIGDAAANALVITCSDTDFETIGDLVAALARPPAAEQVIVKVYPLQSISAERAASNVQQLIAPETRGRGRGRQAARMRTLAIRLLAGRQPIDAVFDPARINIAADAQTNSLIVMAPDDAIGFLDQYIELIDQAPVNVQSTLKLYPLRHAKADELRGTLRGIFRARFQSLRDQPGVRPIEPEFAADVRSNTLLVTASPEQIVEVDRILEDLDSDLGEDVHTLRTIELAAAVPSRAAELLQQVVVGSDQERRAQTLIIPDDNSGVILVRASEEVNAEIDAVIGEIDRDAAKEFEIRTITVERADAEAVANAVQRFFDDRARIASVGRGRREQGRRISIIGDPASKTILVAASDRDFDQVKLLVEQFDSPQATSAWTFRVFELQHAKATEIEDSVNELINNLTWGQGPIFFWGGGFSSRGGNRSQNRGTIAVQADARLNALIVTGEGDKFDLIGKLIDVLDAPPASGDARMVKLYRVENGDLDIVADVIRELFTDMSRRQRWWEPQDPNEVKIRIEERTKTLIISGTGREHEEIGELIASIDSQVAPPDQEIAVLPIEFAEARDLQRTISQFLADRARATGDIGPLASIVASESANSLVIAAPDAELATIRDLLTRLDQPDLSGDRVIEIVALREGDAEEIGRILREQFGRRAGQGVVVTADNRTNSLIINAPKQQFAQALALIEQLDAPSASDETIIRTYALEGARADETVRILTETLQLDPRGETSGITIKLDPETDGVEVKAKIVADRRSNSLIVTATSESFPVIESLIQELDDVPAVSPVEYRIITLKHALATDVVITLDMVGQWAEDGQPRPRFDYNRLENQLIVAATADQFEQIERVVQELDQPSERQRITDFVPLQFAEAAKIQEALEMFYGPYAFEADTPGKRNVSIVADPATNSLVISADDAEWADIRALLGKLDSEEYDSSLQLKVIPLDYADARSVAQAINEAFQGPLERDRRAAEARDRGRGGSNADGDRRDAPPPTVLIESEEWVRASAERQTNSVIVSASRQNIRKIEQIVEQLDVADYAELPAPRLIPVISGDPIQLAGSLNDLYEQADGGRKSLRIVGDKGSSTIIVRAEDDEFDQIRVLADALQQQASEGGVTVRVVKLRAAPARRVADAIGTAYQAKAQQANQPLSIDVDAAGNSLVIAATAGLFEEISRTIEQLDALAPAAGQGIFIIELENIAPEDAKTIIETIGLDEEPRDDSVSRLVTEPIRVSVLTGRRALIVIANPVDRDAIVGLLKAIDAEPALAEAQMRVIRLQHAEAEALAQILGDVLAPTDQQVETKLARAVQEQVRRLSVRRDGLDEGDLQLDLAEPIRVIPDRALNALVVSSTEKNVAAVVELIEMFDALPITDAVTVQIFPLVNIAAEDFRRIVTELFEQGKQLDRVPGTDLEAVPGGVVGKALLDEIAISVDSRTNTIVVAGKEDSVALVEVLTERLDTQVAAGWVEPRLIRLRFADATDLAETLRTVLVEGSTNLAQATPLQQQIGRLRMARSKENGNGVLESDVFQPMARLVIRAEPQLNALLLVGTPINLEVVGELVTMLDTEAASPDATVRIYPVENASATRLASIVTRLFDQQVESKAIRPEDRVIVQPDERTNSIVVTTSPRSFAVLEGLLSTLDVEVAPDLRSIRRIEIRHASAARLADLAQQLMDARLERLRKVLPETADLERSTIVADLRTNNLFVAAGDESFEVIQRLVEDLDMVMLDDDSLVQVIAVETGNVDRIAQTIDAVMERRYADMPAELKAGQQPLVITDTRSNSLLVAANPEDLAAIEDLVRKLAAAPMHPAVGLYVLQVPETTSAEQLAPRIQRLMRERQQSLGDSRQPSDNVTVEAEPIGNTLVVAASPENVEIVRELIDVLDRAEAEATAGRGFELIPLRASRADDVRELLNDLYVDEARRTRGPNAVQVTADDRINAVLVSGAEQDIAAIRELVAQLDGAKPATVVEIKYIPLQSANAIETVGLIQSVLSGRGIGARRTTAQATVLKYLRELEADDRDDVDPPRPGEPAKHAEMEVSAAIRESIVLTPDVRTNTIIVSAPRQSMEMIERMIRDLDTSSTGAKNIRIFKLLNADATAMAEILTDLFNLRQGSNLLVLKPRESMTDGSGGVSPEGAEGLGAGFGGTELTAVPDERQQLSITVDSRTNSLLVSGTPTYLDLVSEVVEELDALEANEREVYVYQLLNAAAIDVARVLGDFIREEQEKLVSTLSADQIGSAARVLEREITIQGDEKSNTVLISASPRYMERVKEMIRQIDVDPPQVLIQVMLAEVTLDDTDDWGVDLFTSGDIGSATVSGGFGFASAFVTGMGVPNLTIAASDFNLMIRALRSQGRVQVLSNPSIMAANNERARIQVGETIRVPESTAFTESGASNTGTIEEQIGIILEVTPSINPDGYVRMVVLPEISRLSQETTQINENFESPIITRRTAETTVTVHDGQTIVIGGLISDRFQRLERKVPFFGDLPLFGELFRSHTEDSVKTELLIVLTPHVIQSPTDWGRVDEVTGGEIDRLTVPESIKRRIREGIIDPNGGFYDAEGNPIETDLDDLLDSPPSREQQP